MKCLFIVSKYESSKYITIDLNPSDSTKVNKTTFRIDRFLGMLLEKTNKLLNILLISIAVTKILTLQIKVYP